MENYERLRLMRHLRAAILQHETSLKELEPGTDYHEMVLGALEEAKQTLEGLQRQEG